MRRIILGSLAVLTAATLGNIGSASAQTLKAVMHTDIKILDPIWTPAYITRNHGYMIYDTLFAMDEKGEIKPQMVETYEESADKLTYKFTLRDGLLWHDGTPVTAEDCTASIKRWAVRDSLGQKLATFIDTMTANDAKTFTVTLKEPTGLLIFGLGKPSSNVPFMMPKRVAETDPNKQISDFTGSGPFVMQHDEWVPMAKVVYLKFDKYKPRAEPPSGLAGGKVAKVSRIEWIAIADQQAATNALLGGEIDYYEQPPADQLPLLKRDNNIKIVDYNKLGVQYSFRFNHLHKPFDNPKVRQAVLHAFNQQDFLDATIGDPEYYKICKSIFPCGSALESTKELDATLTSDFAKAKALLREAGYDGTPIVLMQSTDIVALTNLAPVAKSLLEKAGFKVDLQSMDFQTLVGRRIRKDPPGPFGWHGLLTAWYSSDILNPVMTAFVNASCENAMFGWLCDAGIEKLRDDFARATDPAKQKQIADAVQQRELEVVTHVPLGQYFQPAAMRKNIVGALIAPVPVFWNIEKK